MYEAERVTPVAELGLAIVRLEGGAEEVVVGRVAVCKLVEQDGVDGESTPVLRGRGVGGVLARGVVVERGRGVLVGVEVPAHKILAPWRGGDEEGEEEEGEGEEAHRRKRKGEV